LRQIATDRLTRGEARDDILALFEQVRQELRLAGRETDEDTVMDAMDFLTGWCSPHMKIQTPAKEGSGSDN
jgi:hypothetical protein